MPVAARSSWSMGNEGFQYDFGNQGVDVHPTGNDCAPVLSHSPRGTSEKLHGWAGVRDVSLPENPVPRRLVGSSSISVAAERKLDVSRVLNSVTPGPGSRRRTCLGWPRPQGESANNITSF